MATARSKRTLEAGRRARVLIVDDSRVMQRLVTLALESDPCLEIVGTAKNGIDALDRFRTLAPDVMTMDIEMPGMDGLEALRHIRQISQQVRVVMLSALTDRGALATFEALALGADDYVAKKSGRSVDDSTAELRNELVPKVKQFFSFAGSQTSPETSKVAQTNPVLDAWKPIPSAASKGLERRLKVIGIGISTGGPTALANILPAIPKDFNLPILVVQHMPPLFTKLLCERLQQRSQLSVREAVHGEIVKPGVILIAPGGYHMRVRLARGEPQPRISLDQLPPENSCRPAVDALFESLEHVYGGEVLAAVLTGMGHDGLRGCKLLKKAGAIVLAQDEETSAVWGMPRAVVDANIADAVLPLNEIVPQILRKCQRSAENFRFQENH